MEKEKKPVQNVQFRTVGELLDFLPEDQLAIVERLRELVFECVPEIEERLSFNVPFYRRFKAICFIWPGAVSWGSKTWEGVEFGFNYGHLLADEAGYLDRGTRKQVFSKRFYSVKEIPEDLLRDYIYEAAIIDEEAGKARRLKGKKKG
ncbi:MAG: DUF1801 domain-containing protein [Lewinellaceae bacterium]|nr:DUF1801 domain-containing protein [Saprospiraceae bacterium]MCB9336866.1 DUF1801 domain-containing protein [Lewinellaceae bacterium]